MLNNLSESDPNAYNAFISDQMKDMQSQSDDNSSSTKSSFVIVPKKGFVTESFIIGKEEHKNRMIMFTNFCHHDSINLPLDSENEKIPTD